MERVATLEDELSAKGDENSSLKAKLAKVVAEVEEAHHQVCYPTFSEADMRSFILNIHLNPLNSPNQRYTQRFKS